MELGQTEPRGPHKASGRAPLGSRPVALWRLREPFWPPLQVSRVSFVQKKISKKFRGIWTSFGTDILKNQKQAKKQQLALGTKLIG